MMHKFTYHISRTLKVLNRGRRWTTKSIDSCKYTSYDSILNLSLLKHLHPLELTINRNREILNINHDLRPLMEAI